MTPTPAQIPKDETSEQGDNRNPDGTFKEGVSGNPGGRPTNSMKSYVAKKLAELDEEGKEEWLKTHKIAGMDQWRMGEGNPHQTEESKIEVTLPEPLLGGKSNVINSNDSNRETSKAD